MTDVNIAENIDSHKEYFDSSVIQEVFKDYVDKPVWVAFQVGERKFPTSPHGGIPGKINDKTTWGTFLEVLLYIQRQKSGIWVPGIAVTDAIDLAVVDLDDVCTSSGVLPEAEAITQQMSTYCEYSISGNGLHLYCHASKIGEPCKKTYKSALNETPWEIEIYDKKRFIIVTGKSREPRRPIRAAQSELDDIYLQYFPEKPTGGERMSRTFSPAMSDEDILKLCRSAKNAEKFINIFDGADRTTYGDNESALDMVIWSHLVFYTQDRAQAERIIRSSNWYTTKREDGEKNHKKKFEREDIRSKYGFDKALEGCKSFYQPKVIHKSLGETPNPDTTEATDETLDALSDSIKKAARLLLGDENPCKEFTIEGFPKEIQDYVKAISRSTDASPIMTFASCLGCISAYASKTYVQYFGKLYPNLYQLLLAASGGFKSTALRYGCYFAYETEKASVITQRIALTAAAAIATKPEREREQQNILNMRALASKLLPAKTTAERLFKDLSRGKKGLLPLSEFSDWLSSLEANYNKTLKAIFTDLYDCPPFYEVTTIGNELEPLVITDPYISILGFSAPDWLEGQVSDKDVMKGFFSRFLIFYVKEKGKRLKAWPEAQFTPPEDFKKVLEKIGKCEGEYHFSEEARKHYEVIFDTVQDILAEKKESHALLEPFTKRWCPSILKVALLLHLTESPNVREIPAKHIRSAAKYIGCAIKSTLYIFKSGLLESEFQRNCTAILKYIAERDGKATRKAILTSRRIKTEKKDDNSKTYDEILEFLIESGQLAVIVTAKRNDWVYHLTGDQVE